MAISEGRQKRTIQHPRGDDAGGRQENQRGLKGHGVGSLAGGSVGVKRQRTRLMLASPYISKPQLTEPDDSKQLIREGPWDLSFESQRTV